MQDFRGLDVWKKAHLLVLAIYKATSSLPSDEVFGITIQLRRSAVAVPTRIAEGCGRESNGEMTADLRRAVAGCNEAEYLMLLAKDLGYWNTEIHDTLNKDLVEVRKMIHGFLRKL